MKHGTRSLGSVVVLTVALMAGSPNLFADTIGPDCGAGNCLGNTYTLQFNNLVVGSTTSTFDLLLTINTSGFNGFGAGNIGDLKDAAAKVVTGSSSDILSATLVSAPGGAGNWTAFIGGESAGGCATGSAGFICSAANFPTEADVDTGGTLVFEWSVTISNGTLATGPLGSHVKARFFPEDGTTEKGKPATSADITLQTAAVPEPASILLFGSGLLVLGAKLGRRRQV